MNNYKCKIQILFALVLLLATNKSTSQLTQRQPVVYAAGYGYNTQGEKIAQVWKNGQVEQLGSENNESVANSICVVKGDVFVAGKEGNNATIWINGEARYLTKGQTDSEAKAVFVAGKNVYVAGYRYNSQSEKYIAVVWKNNDPTNLTDGSTSAKANGIFVYKDTVYVCGSDMKRGFMEATIWKNGVSQRLEVDANSSGIASDAAAVFVYNGDVHVTGYKTKNPADSKAMYWKNGVRKVLGLQDTDDSFSKGNSICVENGTVFIAGRLKKNSGSKFKATYWRNTGTNSLSNETGDTEARGIYAAGTDLYMVGYKITSGGKSTYKIWKNGVSHEMGISKYYAGGINAVFVNE